MSHTGYLNSVIFNSNLNISLFEKQEVSLKQKKTFNNIYLPFATKSIFANTLILKSGPGYIESNDYDKPKVSTYRNNDGVSGYFTISWHPDSNTIMYLIAIFNGIYYQYLFVDGNQNSWSTKGKGIYPKKKHFKKGDIGFRADGRGTEFAIDPFLLYSKSSKIYGGNENQSIGFEDTQNYFVRIYSVNTNGEINSLSNELKITL
ncbi:hypothetical protein ACFVR2_06265 [Gottfriedia sp. NPDC057991]|uniref:hypothetical protein n=1 Tax=Gottfriedia sp. NPDC057991 TaxID=3346298 RepID=UPI0036DC7F9D